MHPASDKAKGEIVVERLPVPASVARPLGYPRVANLPEERQEGLRRFWMEGLYSSIALALTDPYYTLYALSLGATSSQIGLVNTLSQLSGATLSLPGAILAERSGRYKWVALVGQFLKQSMWLLMGVVVWLLPLNVALGVFLAGWVAISIFGTLLGSAWSALVAEIVPTPIRGQYFASRNILMQLSKILIVPAAGLFIKSIGEPLGFQIVFVLSFFFGLGALYYFRSLPEHRHHPAASGGEHFGLRQTLRGLRLFHNYRNFVLAHTVLNFGVMLGGPFIQVYMVEAAHFDVATISVLNTIGVFATMVSMYFFGRWQDRFGITWIMRFTAAMPIIPVLWLGVTEPWQGALVQFYASVAWTGYNLGSFNLLLAITPDDHRPRYLALHTTVAALVGSVGPVIGGWLLDATGFLPVFSLSTIFRAAGMILFLALVREPAPAHTETA